MHIHHVPSSHNHVEVYQIYSNIYGNEYAPMTQEIRRTLEFVAPRSGRAAKAGEPCHRKKMKQSHTQKLPNRFVTEEVLADQQPN